jgi:hypothetical protein
MYVIALILIILIIILFLKSNTKKKNDEISSFINYNFNNRMLELSQRPIIWIYLEESLNNDIPSYILLCLYSVYINCYSDFNIIILNPETIYNYLPNLKINMGNLSSIHLKKRKEYISYCLLDKYGGIYLESHIIVLKNLIGVYKHLSKYDFISFPCPDEYYKSYNKNLKPSTEIMISKKNNILMKLCQNDLGKIVFSYNYPNYNFNQSGNSILINNLKIAVIKYNLLHLQLDPDYNGIIDENKEIITTDNLISKNLTYFNNKNKVYLLILNKEQITNKFKYKWLQTSSVDKILNSDLWVNNIFTQSLKLNKNISNVASYEYNYEEINNSKEGDCNLNKGNINGMLVNCNYYNSPVWIKYINK